MNNDEIVKNLDRIVTNYLTLKDQNGQLLIHKYSMTYIYTLVQKHLFDYEAIFSQSQKSIIDVFDFVTSLLQVQLVLNQFTQEALEDTIFIILQAVDFFKSVCEELQTNQIKFSDLSSYLCKYNPNLDEIDVPMQNRIITTHQFPPQNQFNKPQHRKVRSIDVHAPVVLGTLGHYNKRINKDKIYIDSQKNANSSILRIQYQETQMKVMALHQYSDLISVYNPDCTLFRYIKPKAPQLRNIIHDFTWSEEQQRVGIVFKDAYICFLDQGDNYQFEKFFSTKVDQIRIFYVQKKWMSLTSDSKISIWDLETELCSLISHDVLKNVVDILEVVYLQLVCVACQDKLTLWDMMEVEKPKLLFKLQINHSRLNNIVYFHSYHLLITSGFDTKVNLYQLHNKYNDGDYVGQLEGHTSIITAIQCMEQSPIVITCDDRHIVKLWDIRVMKCIQSFDLELRQSICYCLVLRNLQSVCFATNRLLIMNLEGHRKNLKNLKKSIPIKIHYLNTHCYPLSIEYDALRKLLIVGTHKDIRLINILNGQTETVIKTMIGENDDEMTVFKPIQQHKRILLGTSKGHLKIFDIQNGEMIQDLSLHQNKITNICVDYQNRMIITSSLDGTVQMSKERQLKFDLLKKMENIHHSVDLCYVSLYHNIILTAGVDVVAIWNIEFGKLIATLRPNEVPKSIHILDGYSTIVIGGKTQTYLINFSYKDDIIQFNQLGQLIDGCYYCVDKEGILIFTNNSGKVYTFNCAQFNNSTPKVVFNAFRQSWEDYNVAVNNHKIARFVLESNKPLFTNHSIQAHRNRINHIDIIQLEGDNVLKEGQSKVLTASKDGFLKLFSYPNLEQICALNINHPLPIQWQCEINEHEILKFKMAFVLKIIHHIRGKPNLTISQIRMLEPNTLFRGLIASNKEQPIQKEQVELLQDFYEPRDLAYDKVKDYYKNELQGISLKQIDERKKAHIYAQMWEQNIPQSETEIKQIDEQQKDFKQLQQYLNPNFRQKGIQNSIDFVENIDRLHAFEKKLDRITEDNNTQQGNISRRLSRGIIKNARAENKSVNKSSRLRQSQQFFQYATDKKLASMPASTDTSARSTHYGFETQRDDYRSRLDERTKFLSQNLGSLCSDLKDKQKKIGVAIGENTMRKTSSVVFNSIVQKLNEKLKESKFKKINIGNGDMDGDMIDAQLDRLLNSKHKLLITKKYL